MSLYGDLPAAQTGQEPVASLWSAEPPSQGAAVKAAKPVLAAPLSVLRKAAAPAERPRQAKPATAPAQAAAPEPQAAAPAAGQSLIADVDDEYNPAQPNSYEDVLRARALQQKQAELVEKRKALERHRVELLEARRRAEAAALLQQQAYAELPLPPPPPLPPGMQLPPPPPPPLPLPPAVDEEMADDSTAADGKTAAQRMMERMGWREGQGLGKAGDGMTSCLVVKKTDARAGVIVNAPAPKPAPQPTCVLCLRGMVGPGQVDDALEDEVAEECEKCSGGPGSVVQVLIFEATDGSVAPALAVRIFVQFTSVEAAVKARAEMDGRFFGGRQISAVFFDEGRFEATDLAPCAGEFDT